MFENLRLENKSGISCKTLGLLRIELKLLRNKSARTFTPERLQLEPLVALYTPLQIFIVNKKDVYQLHSLSL